MKVLIEMFLTHILNTIQKCVFLNFKYMKSDVRLKENGLGVIL